MQENNTYTYNLDCGCRNSSVFFPFANCPFFSFNTFSNERRVVVICSLSAVLFNRDVPRWQCAKHLAVYLFWSFFSTKQISISTAYSTQTQSQTIWTMALCDTHRTTSYKSNEIHKIQKMSVLKCDISANEVINSINLSPFDMSQCAQKSGCLRIFWLLTPGRSNHPFYEYCRFVDQWSPFELHSNANWRSVSAL